MLMAAPPEDHGDRDEEDQEAAQVRDAHAEPRLCYVMFHVFCNCPCKLYTRAYNIKLQRHALVCC